MATPNPRVAEELRQARDTLARLKADKLQLYPPNQHPFVEPDKFPGSYTPEQIRHRNQLVAEIERLEKQIQDLQDRLYSG